MRFPKSLLLIGALTASVAVLLVMRSGSKHDGTRKADSVPLLPDRVPANSAKLLSQPQAATTAGPVAKVDPAIPGTLGQFGAWAEKFSRAATEQERDSLVAEGEALAQARREELKKLMQTDPALALRELVPYSLRKRLPDAVKP